ncbi:phage terminase large subunit family protein [Phenylobacterium sp.]|uniref:phage terminase large subunit family protein n=1 Tax=Phenylobacterium sp. TaxID=1871053 RepID=UPI002733589E|nr:terminase gpA endonuclease subunit [Phenylobacterium sp.]MDP3853162.1 phage terminase large subunit family protein [Phenylobacterium sp.]
MHVRPFGYAEPVLDANAARIDRAFAASLRPPPRISVADWSAKHRHFGDDSPYPGKYDATRAPYLVEIHDKLSPFDPTSEVPIIKCAQSGGSVTAENWIGYISDVAPGPLMYVQATITAAKDWLAEKFWPMVEATPQLNPERRGSIMPKRSREGNGTTALRVRFKRGGWMLIAGANSAATLRQHSIRYAIEDDLDQFPDDLDNQGSPESMVDARLTTFTRQGIAKRLKISTPTNKGASKIERAYGLSDQRRFYLKCRQCGDRFDPVWDDLKWPDGEPAKVHLKSPCCGYPAAHWEKALMSLADGWVPTVEIDGEKPPRVMSEEDFQQARARDVKGRQPGYHITGIITAFMTWATLCTGFVAAQGDVNKLRTWTNLQLGEVFALKGDAPPAESLEVLRSQDWDKHQLPWGPVVFTLGCDIQGDGIYFEALGWAYGLENWSLDNGFLPGPTDVPSQGAWAVLEDYAKRTFELPGGKAYGFDQIVVDAGYNTEAAKAFCRRSHKRLPIFGRDGWTLPILGRSQPIHYDQGKSNRVKRRKKKAGEDAHFVGTYGAKYSFFGFLRASIQFAEREAKGERAERLPGRIHFGRHATADYFDMLTSESCVVEVKAGQPRRVWKVESGRQNHWLDCRIYNRAAAEAMALDNRSETDWMGLQADRYASPDPLQGDLVARMINPIPVTQPLPTRADNPGAALAVAPAPAAGAPEPSTPWIPAREDWLS